MSHKRASLLTLFVLAALLAAEHPKDVSAQTAVHATNIPLVRIADITKVVNPSLPSGGGPVTFVYKVTNAGSVPLNDVIVTADTCTAMSSELGDVNDNHLLDANETWIYSCTTILRQTTVNDAVVTAYANGLKATDSIATTVTVAATSVAGTASPNLPNEGPNPNTPSFPANGTNPGTLNITLVIWGILGGILVMLLVIFFLARHKK